MIDDPRGYPRAVGAIEQLELSPAVDKSDGTFFFLLPASLSLRRRFSICRVKIQRRHVIGDVGDALTESVDPRVERGADPLASVGGGGQGGRWTAGAVATTTAAGRGGDHHAYRDGKDYGKERNGKVR